MKSEQDLITVTGWEKDKFGPKICEWVYTVPEESTTDFDTFAVVMQEESPDRFRVEVTVTFPEPTKTGDLLSSEYQRTLSTEDEAEATVDEFITVVETEYL